MICLSAFCQRMQAVELVGQGGHGTCRSASMKGCGAAFGAACTGGSGPSKSRKLGVGGEDLKHVSHLDESRHVKLKRTNN